MKSKKKEAPKFSIEYPTADECRAFGKRLDALANAVKAKSGYMGTAALRAAIDLDYLSRLIDADPVKNVGQWSIEIKPVDDVEAMMAKWTPAKEIQPSLKRAVKAFAKRATKRAKKKAA